MLLGLFWNAGGQANEYAIESRTNRACACRNTDYHDAGDERIFQGCHAAPVPNQSVSEILHGGDIGLPSQRGCALAYYNAVSLWSWQALPFCKVYEAVEALRRFLSPYQTYGISRAVDLM